VTWIGVEVQNWNSFSNTIWQGSIHFRNGLAIVKISAIAGLPMHCLNCARCLWNVSSIVFFLTFEFSSTYLSACFYLN